MAKKAPSKHSRAARRATSPGIDTDKSLKNVKPPEESVNFRPAVLALHHSAGVTKKSKSGRKATLSSKARRRQEKGLDRAEAVMERTSLKVQKSRDQSRVIQGRRKAWEEINSLVGEAAPAASKKKQAQKQKADEEQEAVDNFFRDDGDEDMEEATESSAPAADPVAAAVPLSAAPAVDDEDDIL